MLFTEVLIHFCAAENRGGSTCLSGRIAVKSDILWVAMGLKQLVMEWDGLAGRRLIGGEEL